jgi:hypothetical protein
MALRIEIRLTDNPSDGDNFILALKAPSKFYSPTIQTYEFKSTPTNGFIHIKATKELTSISMFSFITNIFSIFDWVEVVQQTDGVDLILNAIDAEIIILPPPIEGDITITIIEIETPPLSRNEIVLSRSPFNVKITPNVLFDSAVLNLKIYRGDLNLDLPLLTSYTMSKSVIIAGQTSINFEISRFLNDFCKSNIIPFGTTGVSTSSLYDSIWFETEIKAYYVNEVIAETTKKYLAIDGYGFHTELFNPKLTKNVLSTNNRHIIYNNSECPLYFVSKGLVAIAINGVDIPFTLDENINNQLISFINIRAYIGSNELLTAIFTYEDSIVETHYFTIKKSCKYPLYNIFFKNKFGYWQSIPFNLKSKKEVEVETSSYNPTISYNGEYSLLSHGVKTQINNVSEKLTINTDFIPEYYNDIIEEMMYSEFVYAETNGQYLPINLNKKSFDKKTRIFDKNIQYTFDFKYSFNKINNII